MNNVESYKFNPTNQNILNKQRELWGLPTKKPLYWNCLI